jgi:hypothetical protein
MQGQREGASASPQAATNAMEPVDARSGDRYRAAEPVGGTMSTMSASAHPCEVRGPASSRYRRRLLDVSAPGGVRGTSPRTAASCAAAVPATRPSSVRFNQRDWSGCRVTGANGMPGQLPSASPRTRRRSAARSTTSSTFSQVAAGPGVAAVGVEPAQQLQLRPRPAAVRRAPDGASALVFTIQRWGVCRSDAFPAAAVLGDPRGEHAGRVVVDVAV